MAKLQATDSDCGITAIQNALRVLGVRVGYKRIRRALKNPDDPKWDIADGVDEFDMQRATSALGFGFDELNTNRKFDAREWLRTRAPVMPVLLCVDDWEHWVSVAGLCDRRLCLQDPSRDAYNAAELGIAWLRLSTILRRWRASSKRRSEGGLYYGLAILPR